MSNHSHHVYTEEGMAINHAYEVTITYNKSDKHINVENIESGLGWAELLDHDIIIYTYNIRAESLQAAINKAIDMDNLRKLEMAATWPSLVEGFPEEITPKLLQDFYFYLCDKNHFNSWFFQDPTTISGLLVDNKETIMLDMENQFIERSETFISDIANWANKSHEEE